MSKKNVALLLSLLGLVCLIYGISRALANPPHAFAQGLPAPPATWSATDLKVSGQAAASVSIAAGGSGVQHVATCISANMVSAGVGSTWCHGNVRLRNGPSGSGTPLQQWSLTVPGSNNTVGVSQCDLNVVGSPNTAMTLEFDGICSSGGTVQTVNLVGYDAS